MENTASLKKPNIVIVMTDQQRADLRKGCGYPLDTMPHLDRFANEGVEFTRAYTPNPTCMPARVSLFTGRYPSCHRVRTNHNAADAYYTRDLLDVLKENGYRTALCGKNHSHRRPADFDFHRVNGHLGYEGEINRSESEKEFADFLKSTNHMETDFPSPGGTEVQHPYRNVTDALDFIDSCEKDRPFFAWVSFAEPHNPYQVPKPYFDMFPPESLPNPGTSAENLGAKGDEYPWLRGVWEKVLGEDIEKRILRARSNYLGMLRLIDDQFGRLVEGLDRRGLSENTLVIFMSDHGDFAGEYGLIRKGVGLSEPLIHIPLAMRGPGVSAHGRIDNAFVNTVDILPTICDLLGVEIPFGVQGKSLLPLTLGKSCPEHEYDTGYSESGFGGLFWNGRDRLTPAEENACDEKMTRFDCLNTWTQCGTLRTALCGDLKIQADMSGRVFLYNLKDDPHEINNLADNPGYEKEKCFMLGKLVTAVLRAADSLPSPRHRYRVKRHPRGFWEDGGYVSDDPGVHGFPDLKPKSE